MYLGDYSARIMKFAKLKLEFRCREEQKEDVTEPCWDGNSFHNLDNLLWTAGLSVLSGELCLKCSDL